MNESQPAGSGAVMDDRKVPPAPPPATDGSEGPRFLMAFRQFPGPLAVAVLLALAGLAAGCSLGRAPSYGFQASEQPTAQSLPGDPVDVPENGHAPPPVSLESIVPATDPPPPSPLALAIVRADSYYERGLQAMRSGDADQAEWEFDAALETLLDNGLSPAVPPRLTGTHRSSPPSLSSWLTPPVLPPQDTVVEIAPPDPDEPTQEAPALLAPEGVEETAKEQPEERDAVPEPDTDTS